MKNQQPIRAYVRCKNGRKTTVYCSYTALKTAQKEGRLIGAWSTSTGKSLSYAYAKLGG